MLSYTLYNMGVPNTLELLATDSLTLSKFDQLGFRLNLHILEDSMEVAQTFSSMYQINWQQIVQQYVYMCGYMSIWKGCLRMHRPKNVKILVQVYLLKSRICFIVILL